MNPKTKDEIETWEWVKKNFVYFNQARKIRLGRIIFDVDVDGKIQAKYEISGNGFLILMNNTKRT